MSKYIAKRDELYSGILSEIHSRPSYNKELNSDESSFHKCFYTFQKFRTMLFKLNENNQAEDFLYTTPTSYSIDKFTKFLEPQDLFLITNFLPLGPVLTLFNFPNDLTLDDLRKIIQILSNKKSFFEKNASILKSISFGTYLDFQEITNHTLTPNSLEPNYSKIKKKIYK